MEPMFRVFADGKPVRVEECRVSAVPFNTPVFRAEGRPLDQTEIAYFAQYCGELPVTVKVQRKTPCSRNLIRPISKGIGAEEKDGDILFTVREYGSYVLEGEDEHGALHLFFAEKSSAKKEDVTYYFGPGVHKVGLLALKSGESVYLEQGAVLVGSIYGEGVENVRIFGRGIVDGSYERRANGHCYRKDTVGDIKFYSSKNIRVEGIILKESAIWVVNMFDCSNVLIDGIKIVGNWQYNTDGIDIVNSSDVTIRNSFVRSFDDGIVLKGIDAYAHHNVTDITVENCVVWCGWGRTLEVGLETACEKYENIVFRNCDLIHNSFAALDVQNGDYATIRDVLFENIRVEFCSSCLPEQLQYTLEQKYDGKPTAAQRILTVMNRKYNPDNDPILNKNSDQYGKILQITLKDIQMYSDFECRPPVELLAPNAFSDFGRIVLDNITFNGRKLENLSEFDFRGNFTEKALEELFEFRK